MRIKYIQIIANTNFTLRLFLKEIKSTLHSGISYTVH